MALARRDYLNNPDARAKMAEAGQGMGQLANIPAKSTRGYGTADLHRGMMTAAALNASVGGCAGAVRRHVERRGDNPDGVVPCGQWFSDRLAGVDVGEATDSFCDMAAAQLGGLEEAGMMPEGGWTVALDRGPGPWPWTCIVMAIKFAIKFTIHTRILPTVLASPMVQPNRLA